RPAPAAGAADRHSLAWHCHQIARLYSRRDRVLERPVQARHLNFRAERRLAERDRHVANQVVLLAAKHRVVAHQDFANQVARRGSRFPRFAFAAPLQTIAMIDARGNVDFNLARDLDPASATALGTRVGDYFALAAARVAAGPHLERAHADLGRASAIALPTPRWFAA